MNPATVFARRTLYAPLVAVLVLLSSGCTDVDQPAPDSTLPTFASLRAALEGGEIGDELALDVVLVTENGGVPYLCDTVDESLPQRCGQPRVQILDAPLDAFDLVEEAGELSGHVRVVVVVRSEGTVSYISGE